MDDVVHDGAENETLFSRWNLEYVFELVQRGHLLYLSRAEGEK